MKLKTRPGLWRVLNARANGMQPHDAGKPAEPSYARKPLAIVIGYGPVGRTLTRLLA